MRISRLTIAKPDIQSFFDKLPSKVLTHKDIDRILSQNQGFWRLGSSITTNKFIDFLLDATKLKLAKFNFPSRNVNRYVWGEVYLYELVLSLKPDSFFTHYTAMYLHELTEQIPKTVYLNFEQLPKQTGKADLVQERIDTAFKRPSRTSNNIALYDGYKIFLLNGMFSGKLGVIDNIGPNGEKVSVTDVERTLIDIAVRPIYSGGVFEVLKAYKLARNKVSINKLSALLSKLNFKYPYFQAIGFYLDKAGVYKESQIDLLRQTKMKYDFYLTYQMKDMDYSHKWRLYFPKGF